MVAYTGDYDGNLDVYVISAAGGQPRRLTYHPGPEAAVGWTPDGKWLAYTKQLDNHLHAVFVYSLATGKATQITDGTSDALFPNFA
jgi:tricorn protease